MFDKIKIDKTQLFVIFLIFLLGFGIRAWQMQWELFFEFDSYFHARWVSYILKDGFVPNRDPLGYYQLGGAVMTNLYYGFWYFCALIYKIFTLNAPYSKELWILFVKLIPAVFGALTAVAIYFLAKEMFNSKEAGVGAGIIAATIPAFVYRTMGGFFEEDSVGFLWLVLGFYFLIKSQKTEEKIKIYFYSVLSGILFTIMGLMWGMFLVVPLIISGYLIIGGLDQLIKGYLKKNFENTKKFILTTIISLAVFSILITLWFGTSWILSILDYATMVLPKGNLLLGVSLGLLIFGFLGYVFIVSSKNIRENKLIQYIVPGSLYLAIVAVAIFFIIKPDLREGSTSVIAWTVGEESIGRNYFWNKYNALVFIPYLGLLFLPLYIYKNKEKGHFAIIAFIWTLLTFFMAWYKLKFTYTLGLPLSLCSGFIVYETLEFAKKRKGIERAFLVLIVLFLFLIGVSAGSFFVTQNTPTIEEMPYWKETLAWMKENIPEDANLFNWWDEGHWIAFMAERKVFVDNRNYDLASDANYAQFIIEEDENKAYDLIQHFKVDYVIIGLDSVLNQQSMAVYAYLTVNFSDPRLRGFFGTVIPCSREAKNDIIKYNCGGLQYTEDEFNSLPTKWQKEQNGVIPISTQNGYTLMKVNIYKDPSNDFIYIFSKRSNESNATKIWLNNENTEKKYELAHSNFYVKIFKVK